jgi:phosphoglycolate phosphatase
VTAKLEAIVFDLDGTLIDSAPELTSALNSGLSEVGRRQLDVEEVITMIGDGIAKLVERGLEATGGPLGAERFREVTDRVQEFYWNVEISPPYPGVPEMLEKLHGDGLKLAVCTNKPYEPALKILQGVGIADRFSAITGGDGPAGRKPDAGPLRALLAEIGAAPEAAVMVGDSHNDVGTARAAGVAAIAVAYGYSAVPVEELGADIVIESIDMLPGAIAELGFA